AAPTVTATVAAVATAIAAGAGPTVATAVAAMATATVPKGRRVCATGERHHQDNTVHLENLLQTSGMSQPTRKVPKSSLPGAVVAKIVKIQKIDKLDGW